MQDSALKIYRRILDSWNKLEKSKKIKIIITAAIVLIALSVTVFFLLRPNMITIERNLDPVTLSGMNKVLNDNGVPTEITDNTSAIAVRDKDVDKAKLLLAENGYSNPGFTYADAFELTTIGTTESVKKEVFKVQAEEKIARTIELIDAVKTAKVNLALPETSRIVENANKPTASVLLDLKSDLSRENVIAIANIVAKSVEGLDLENVAISDSKGNKLYSSDETGVAGQIASQYELEVKNKVDIESKVQQVLNPVYDDVRVAVSLKMDWNAETVSEKIFTPVNDENNTGVVKSQSTVEDKVENQPGTGQEPGLATNDAANTTPNTYQFGGDGASKGSHKQTDTEYVISEELRQRDKSIGEVLSAQSSIAVYVYNNKTYFEKELIDNGTLNDNLTWQAFKEQTKATQFPANYDYTPTIQSLAAATGINNITMIGYEVPIFEDYVTAPRSLDQLFIAILLLLLIGLLAFALIRKTQPDEITEIEPELSVEELLISEGDGIMEAAGDSVQSIDYTIDSELKRQIDNFIDDKPEAAAQLLRNWLSDEWE